MDERKRIFTNYDAPETQEIMRFTLIRWSPLAAR